MNKKVIPLGEPGAINKPYYAGSHTNHNARKWAVRQAQRGGSCGFDDCSCPQGKLHFDASGDWGPSVDRFPIPGRNGGTYTPENIRLAHVKCNKIEGLRLNIQTPAKAESSRKNWRSIPRERLVAAGNNPNSRNLTQPDQVRGGNIGRCKRWRINRNQPCDCGISYT